MVGSSDASERVHRSSRNPRWALGPWVAWALACPLAWSAAAQEAEPDIPALIAQNIEEPMQRAQVKLPEPAGQGRYGKEFFDVVRAYLDKGLKHDAYAALVGYATERELKTAVGNAATLRDAVDQVKARNREFKTRADQLAKDLVKAQNDTKSSKRTAEDIRRRLQTRINGLIKDMARLKQRHRNEVEGLRRKLTKANRAVHKADKKAE